MNPDNKVAIITGGGTGVGAATSQWLAKRKYNVLVNYSRSEGEAEETAAACQSIGADAVAVQGDVAEDADCRRIVNAAIARWGHLDALVNNAATTVFVPAGNLDGIDAAAFDRVFRVNVVGPFQMTRAAAPHLRERGGAVVNVSSMAGTSANGSSLAYSASKAALNNLTIALARGLAPDIRVNAVAPGMIEGRWLKQGLGEEKYEKGRMATLEASPLRRIATPELVANVIGWLLTDAVLMTGQVIPVDAGMSIALAHR
jgi:3-oxoacyl-[acyl-carrier protein] reductase